MDGVGEIDVDGPDSDAGVDGTDFFDFVDFSDFFGFGAGKDDGRSMNRVVGRSEHFLFLQNKFPLLHSPVR